MLFVWDWIRHIVSLFLVAATALGSVVPTAVEAAADRTGAFTPSQPTGQPSTPPLFGVQVYGDTGTDSPFFPALVASGAGWIRVSFNWSDVEPANVTPDQYNWSSVDAATAAARALGIEVVLTLEKAPSWAATFAEGPIDQVDLSELQELVRAVVERYDGDGADDAPGSPVVRFFEFYNEPDRYCGGAFSWGADGDKYAQMLQAVYPVVKAANPAAQVVIGGIAHEWLNSVDENGICDPSRLELDDPSTPEIEGWVIAGGSFTVEFLEEVLAACGQPAQEECFDVMNFHHYTEFAPNWTRFEGGNGLSVGLYEKTMYLRQKLAQYGLGDKPIIVTEAGKRSNGDDPDIADRTGTPEMQARHVVVLYVQAMAANVRSLAWWMLYDVAPDALYKTGLVTTSGAEKPAMEAYQTISAELGTADFVQILGPAETGVPLNSFPTLEAYQFIDPHNGRTIYVAWLNPMWEYGTHAAMQAPVPLQVPGQQATVRDIYGTIQAVLADDQDGNVDSTVSVPITGAPVYIEVAWPAHHRFFLPAVGD